MKKIPLFPKFEKLILKHRKEINNFLHTNSPHSDFNFTSLWGFNTEDTFEISRLFDNLVIKFSGYFENIPFYSFLGKNNIEETVSTLLDHAENHNIDPRLKLISESILEQAPFLYEKFTIQEDRDNFDYILSIPELVTLAGGTYAGERKVIHRLLSRNNDFVVKLLDINDIQIKKEIINCFSFWALKKGKSEENISHERTAIERILRDSCFLNLVAIGLYKDNSLIAFSISDAEHPEYAQALFLKADPSYNGIRHLLHHSLAKELSKRGHTFLNLEQDLGIPSLRDAKMQMKPIRLLKKYTISRKLLR